MLNAKELSECRTSVVGKKTLPAKGFKAFKPTNSSFEKQQIEDLLRERFRLLKEQKVERSGSLSKGEWDEKLKKVGVTKVVGRHFQVVGHERGGKIWLYAEEALYLLEQNYLELFYNGVPLSIQQGYCIMLGGDTGCTLNEYRVYAHLMRQGYRVLRHSRSLTVTRYERVIGLHPYVLNQKTRSKSPAEPVHVKISRMLQEKSDAAVEVDDDIIVLSDSDDDDDDDLPKRRRKQESPQRHPYPSNSVKSNKVTEKSLKEKTASSQIKASPSEECLIDELNNPSSNSVQETKEEMAALKAVNDKVSSDQNLSKNTQAGCKTVNSRDYDSADSDEIQEVFRTSYSTTSSTSKMQQSEKRKRNQCDINVVKPGKRTKTLNNKVKTKKPKHDEIENVIKTRKDASISLVGDESNDSCVMVKEKSEKDGDIVVLKSSEGNTLIGDTRNNVNSSKESKLRSPAVKEECETVSRNESNTGCERMEVDTQMERIEPVKSEGEQIEAETSANPVLHPVKEEREGTKAEAQMKNDTSVRRPVKEEHEQIEAVAQVKHETSVLHPVKEERVKAETQIDGNISVRPLKVEQESNVSQAAPEVSKISIKGEQEAVIQTQCDAPALPIYRDSEENATASTVNSKIYIPSVKNESDVRVENNVPVKTEGKGEKLVLQEDGGEPVSSTTAANKMNSSPTNTPDTKTSLPMETDNISVESDTNDGHNFLQNGYRKHNNKEKSLQQASKETLELSDDSDEPQIDVVAEISTHMEMQANDIDVVDLSSDDEALTPDQKRSVLDGIPSVENAFCIHVRTPPSHLLPENVCPHKTDYYIQLWRLKASGYGGRPRSSTPEQKRNAQPPREEVRINPWISQNPVLPLLNNYMQSNVPLQFQNPFLSLIAGAGPSLLGPVPLPQFSNPFLNVFSNIMPQYQNFQNGYMYGQHTATPFNFGRGNYRGGNRFPYRGRGRGRRRPFRRPMVNGRDIPNRSNFIEQQRNSPNSGSNNSDEVDTKVGTGNNSSVESDDNEIIECTSPVNKSKTYKYRKGRDKNKMQATKTKGRFFNPSKKYADIMDEMVKEAVNKRYRNKENADSLDVAEIDDPDDVVFIKEESRYSGDVVTLSSDSESESSVDSYSSPSSGDIDDNDDDDDEDDDNDDSSVIEDDEENSDDEEEEEVTDESETVPIIQPEDCSILDDVMSKLKIFEDAEINPDLPAPPADLKISYDVFLPHAVFRKASPGLPNYRLVVRSYEELFPEPGDLAWLSKQFEDGVRILLADVSPDAISFLTLNEIQLPSYYEN